MSSSHALRRRKANEVVWSGSPSILAMIGDYVRGLFSVAIIVGLFYALTLANVVAIWEVVIAGLALFSSVFGYLHLKRKMTRYTLTRTRVMMQEGVLNIRKEQAGLEKINNIIVERSLIERLFKIGTLSIETANDSSEAQLRLYGVVNPERVEALMDELCNALDTDQEWGSDDSDLDLSFLDD